MSAYNITNFDSLPSGAVAVHYLSIYPSAGVQCAESQTTSVWCITSALWCVDGAPRLQPGDAPGARAGQSPSRRLQGLAASC